MAKVNPRRNQSLKKPRQLVTKTMIDAAVTARHSAAVMGSEFFGVTFLSFVAGFVDTAGVLALFGLFTAHVTGDLIVAAAALTEGIHPDAMIKLLMIPIFMVTVAFTTLLLRSMRRRGAASIAPLLFVMTLFMAAFTAASYYCKPWMENANGWGIALVGGLGVASMGIQNAMMRGALKSFAPTTVMTGNLAQFTIDVTELFFPPHFDSEADKKRARGKMGFRLRKSGLPLFGFMLGAGTGAWLTKIYGLLCLAIPTGIIFILAVITAIRSRKR